GVARLGQPALQAGGRTVEDFLRLLEEDIHQFAVDIRLGRQPLPCCHSGLGLGGRRLHRRGRRFDRHGEQLRSEEHTSELQSRENLVCRLLLEKKKKIKKICIRV